MILDFSTNWKHYAKGNEEIWMDAFDFIASIEGDAEEKKYQIRGNDFFAFVQGYETHPASQGKIETHHDYLDIHAIITGNELVYYSHVNNLELIEDFTPKSDDLLYYFNPELANSFMLYPGRFALFFPEEGHMTRIQSSEKPTRIKKVVIKIDKTLFY